MRKFLKENIFPVSQHEYVKFILLTSICFLSCFNYTVLRNLKETLIITEPELGTTVIPFLRTYFLLPIMVGITALYVYLSSRLKHINVILIIIGAFLGYFLIFVFYLYPRSEIFQAKVLGEKIISVYPQALTQMGKVVQFWSHSIYYCLSEAWGSIVILVLFWGTCNSINTKEEAKRFYSPIILFTNFSGLFAGNISLYFSKSDIKFLFFPRADTWSATISSLTLLICLTTVLILFFFYLVLRNSNLSFSEKKGDSVKSSKYSIKTALKLIVREKKIFVTAVMILAYFFSTGIMELVWKDYLRQLKPQSNDFNNVLSQVTSWISILSVLLTLFLSGSLIRKYPWKLVASITPVVLLIPLGSLLILKLFFFNTNFYLVLACTIAGSYFFVNRLCKFVFFDLCKEIAFVDYPKETQFQTKAVLDGIFPKVGKATEAIFLQSIVFMFSGLSSGVFAIVSVLIAINLLWTYSLYTFKEKPVEEDHDKQTVYS
ncbi:MAG: ADP,ATP carrier protein 1 [Chlamydiae bacterium]|nr:ADP,ATP carrier protein 1 [Chlamydiota bacterium]